MTKNFPVSAIIVCYNEEQKLEKCLNSISFFDEIIFIDLNSTDDSIRVAKKFTDKIFSHKREPIVELVQKKFIKKTKNEWIVFIDPDEILNLNLQKKIGGLSHILKDKKYGSISVRWRFFFSRQPLNGTIWGLNKFKTIFYRKKALEFRATIHTSKVLKHEFKNFIIEDNNSYLNHFWVDNTKDFLEKQKRYLPFEVNRKLRNGYKVTYIKTLFHIPAHFFYCFILKKGYKDGFLGLKLSILWSYYNLIINLKILKII